MTLGLRCTAALLATLGACDRFSRSVPAVGDAGARPSAQAVTLPPTGDRWTLQATLVNGALPDRAVVLVHQLGSQRGEWAPLVYRLRRAPAVTTLAVDLRGHGESVRGPLGDTVRWSDFGTDPRAWAGVTRDVDAALAFLAQGQFRRVVLVGAGLGAAACLSAAARSEVVDGLLMISPGLGDHGLDVRGPMSSLAQPGARARRVLMLGGAMDPPAAEAIPALAGLGGAGVETALYAGEPRHGVSLCNSDPTRWDRAEAFVREVLDARVPVAVRDGGAR